MIEFVKKIIPKIIALKPFSIDEEDLITLSRIASVGCDPRRLKHVSSLNLSSVLKDDRLSLRWSESSRIDFLNDIPEVTRAINPGDRRVLHYLIDHFRPKRVLEIGTHVGASTAWMASLLDRHAKEDGIGFQLTTVDIKHVNSDMDRYWTNFGAMMSPYERMVRLGVAERVSFVTQDSIDYLNACKDTFDFVFLDGNHKASHVYREIPILLERLNEDGVILMHDYCPGGVALWESEKPIIGPYEAVRRHRMEGKPLVALPLGSLPWETKQGSHVTSMAMLMRED